MPPHRICQCGDFHSNGISISAAAAVRRVNGGDEMIQNNAPELRPPRLRWPPRQRSHSAFVFVPRSLRFFFC